MGYSTFDPPFYSTTIPTFSPFYSPTIPPTYSTPVPTSPPTPTFPSYPYHNQYHISNHHNGYQYPTLISEPSSFNIPHTNTPQPPNPTQSHLYPLYSPSNLYPENCNYYQNTSLPPSTITHNTTHTLQQQPHVVQPSYHQHLLNTTHHIGLSSHQIQPPPPTFVSSQTAPSSLQQQIHSSCSQSVAKFKNQETTQNILLKFSEIDEKYNKIFSEISERYKPEDKESQRLFDEKLQAIRLDLKEKLQKISDKYRKEIFVVKNQEKNEEESTETDATTVVESAEKIIDGGNDFFSMTNQNLEIIEKEYKEEQEQEFTTHHDSLSTSLCPKPPTKTQFPSTLSAPPSKPPYLHLQKVTVVYQEMFLHPTPKTKLSPLLALPRPPPEPPDRHSTPEMILPPETEPIPPSLLNPSLTSTLKPPSPKPPDSSISRYSKKEFLAAEIIFTEKLVVISSDVKFSPAPPPKPPDLRSPPFLSKSLLNNSLPRPPENVSSLIPASPPPPKSPDHRLLTRASTPSHSSSFVSLKSTIKIQSQPLDPFVVMLGKSEPYIESTILEKLDGPIMHQHVAVCTDEKFLTYLLYCVWSIVPRIMLHYSLTNVLAATSCPSLCQLPPIQQFSPTKACQVSTLQKHLSSDSPRFHSQQQLKIQVWALMEMGQIFCFGRYFYGPKSEMLKVSLQHNLVGPPHIRPTRKPPDLYLNLEDKVQVNPAAMIED